jgi:hypothetical protein
MKPFLYILWTALLVSVLLTPWKPQPSQSETLLYEACVERGGLPQFNAWGYTVGCVGFGAKK